MGGEYCVPASAVTLFEFEERLSEGDRGLFWEVELDFGDGGMFRGKAAGGGGLMYEVRGERVKAREPLYEESGEQDELLGCSVGEGDEVIISISAGE